MTSLLDEILEDKDIRQFLKEYKKSQWVETIKKTLVYGIHSFQALQTAGFSSPYLPLSTPRSGCIKKTSQQRSRNRKHTSKSNKPEPSHSKQRKLTPRDRIEQPSYKHSSKEKYQTKRKISKKLINIQSKIKHQLNRDRSNTRREQKKTFKENQEPEWSGSRNYSVIQENRFVKLVKFQPESQSIFSNEALGTYNPSEDMKKFYQGEFKKLLPDDVPRRLQPVELPLESTLRSDCVDGLQDSSSDISF